MLTLSAWMVFAFIVFYVGLDIYDQIGDTSDWVGDFATDWAVGELETQLCSSFASGRAPPVVTRSRVQGNLRLAPPLTGTHSPLCCAPSRRCLCGEHCPVEGPTLPDS